MMAPTAAPAFTRPLTKARSFGGYHSDVTLLAAMKLPGSPSPSSMRNAPRPNALLTKACSMFAADHHVMNRPSDSRVPQRSTITPETTYISV